MMLNNVLIYFKSGFKQRVFISDAHLDSLLSELASRSARRSMSYSGTTEVLSHGPDTEDVRVVVALSCVEQVLVSTRRVHVAVSE